MTRLSIILAAALLLASCNDSGVVVGDGSTTGNAQNSGTATGSAGTGTTTGSAGTGTTGGTNTGGTGGEEVVTGTGDPIATTAASNLDAADVDAARFLNQATFGASEQSIAEFRTFSSKTAWIDAQINLPVSLTLPYTLENSNGSRREPRHEVWINNVLDEPDQLRQRVAFALSQIFVVSDQDRALANAQYGMSDYYDMLSRNAFGNLRTLLEDVALHPVMGVYLGMVRNEKANFEENIRPDENFAREVLQLFSVGLFQLDNQGQVINPSNPTPTYNQQTIEEFARVFTGWEYPVSRYWGDTNLVSDAFQGRMVPVEEFHDTGSKTLLNGQVVPAGLSTAQDMQRALDIIFNHSNVGPFISKQLIQRLVTSNPSPAYVGRVNAVFANNGSGVRGDLEAVIKAILLDNEAQQGVAVNPDFGKIREPNIKLAHYWRALEAYPGPQANGIHRTADFSTNRLDEMGGQAVMKSRSVFNFYLPDNKLRPGGDLLSPEMQNMSEAFIAATHINYHHMIYRFHNRANLNDDNPRVTLTDFENLATLSSNPDDLLDWYNLIFFAGDMPDSMRVTMFDYMQTLPNNNDGRFARVQDTLFMVMVSPAFNIQR